MGKAFVGFSATSKQVGFEARGIATGKWGCGVFGGDAATKMVIQWIAASLAGRDCQFHPFDKPEETAKFQNLATLCSTFTVGELYKRLVAATQAKTPGEPLLEQLILSIDGGPTKVTASKSDAIDLIDSSDEEGP